MAVGDVVGHGLAAAGVMGQLRSALSAASRVADGPAQALEVLGLYARSVDGAENRPPSVTAVIDWDHHTITYSSAGHLPPALLHPDGTVEFLDQATDPPLGARPEPVPRPQAATAFAEGATLVLYTDGLIERRREDIDVGLDRLADSLARHQGVDPEPLADAVLARTAPARRRHRRHRPGHRPALTVPAGRCPATPPVPDHAPRGVAACVQERNTWPMIPS